MKHSNLFLLYTGLVAKRRLCRPLLHSESFGQVMGRQRHQAFADLDIFAIATRERSRGNEFDDWRGLWIHALRYDGAAQIAIRNHTHELHVFLFNSRLTQSAQASSIRTPGESWLQMKAKRRTRAAS